MLCHVQDAVVLVARAEGVAANVSTQPEPDSPPSLRAGHVQDRILSPVAGAKKGWRNEHESALAAYYARGLLTGGDGRVTASMRLEAGEEYRRLYELLERSGKDSTQRLLSGVGGGEAFTIAQADASTKLVSINSHIGANDRTILRRVCYENYWPSVVIRDLDPGYRDAIVPRFREALDALILAVHEAKKSGWKFQP